MIAVLTDSACDLAAGTLERRLVGTVPVGEEAGGGDAASFQALQERYLRVFDGVLCLPSLVATNLGPVASSRAGELRSGLAGAALGELVLAASDLARAGRGLGSIAAAAREMSANASVLYSFPDTDFLARAGESLPLSYRLPVRGAVRPMAAWREGRFRPLARVRPEAAWAAMAEAIREEAGKAPIRLGVSLAAGEAAQAEAAREAVRAAGLRVKRGRVYQIGPALTALLGPGVFGLCALPA